MTTCKETQKDLDWANNIGFRSLLHIHTRTHTHMFVLELDLESNTYFVECVLNQEKNAQVCCIQLYILFLSQLIIVQIIEIGIQFCVLSPNPLIPFSLSQARIRLALTMLSCSNGVHLHSLETLLRCSSYHQTLSQSVTALFSAVGVQEFSLPRIKSLTTLK